MRATQSVKDTQEQSDLILKSRIGLILVEMEYHDTVQEHKQSKGSLALLLRIRGRIETSVSASLHLTNHHI